MPLRDVGSLARLLLRQAMVPLLVLLGLLFYVHGTATVPTLGGGGWMSRDVSRGLPLPTPTLHYLLGDGLPTLGSMHPATGPLGLDEAQIASLALYDALGVMPHDPTSIFESAFAGFGFAPSSRSSGSSSLDSWLGELPKAPASKPKSLPGGMRIYGSGTPIVGLYATEGMAAYVGRPAAENAPPPTSAERSRDVLGVVQTLAQDLARDGVPTIASLQRNDSEGELGVYLKSYAVARSILKAQPQIAILLDVERPTFPSVAPTVLVSGKRVASVALVVGTGTNLPQPHAAQNLALAKSLGGYLQQSLPKVFAGVVRSTDRLNQQLSPTMLTIDVGGPQATPEEARAALPGIAQAIADFLGGAPTP